jgi:hypothetical protein
MMEWWACPSCLFFCFWFAATVVARGKALASRQQPARRVEASGR